MPSDPAELGAEPRRLHPASLIFSIGSAARRLLLPGFILFFAASRGGNVEIWAMLLFFPALATAVIRYLSFRYALRDEEMMIREGVIVRNERHIPYHRIQNIDLVQNPVHRWLQVAEVRLETAGGEKPEAVIRVLSLADVERMRSRVFAERASSSAAAAGASTAGAGASAPGRLIHRMPPREVALFGIISNQGMVVVVAALGLMWQLDVGERWFGSFFKEAPDQLTSLQPTEHPLAAIFIGIAALLALLVVLRAFSVGWAFLKLHDFSLRRQGEDLRAEYGWLTQLSKTVPRRRIQVVSARETFLHRRFGRVAVQVETAGGAGDEPDSRVDRTWLAPLIRKRELGALMREALPELDLESVCWEPLAPKAARRILRRSLVLAAIPTVALTVAVGAWGLLPVLVLVPWAWAHARLYVRHTGYAVTSDAILYRSGWWVRRLSAARFTKIQALELTATPFDRRNDMASLRVDTAGAGHVGHRIAVAFIEAQKALSLFDRLFHEAGRTSFRW
jgi:putative membrane protein